MDKEIMLFGEAANRYITFKYVETFIGFGIIIIIIAGAVILAWKILKDN